MIETGYGISLRPLALFANEIYADCDTSCFKRIHDNVRARAAVEDVPHDVQMVHHQLFDDPAHVDDKIFGLVGGNDRRDDVFVIFFFVMYLVVGVEQLVATRLTSSGATTMCSGWARPPEAGPVLQRS